MKLKYGGNGGYDGGDANFGPEETESLARGYVPTIQSAPSLYNTDWTPSGKQALVKALEARGLNPAQIADELNKLGIR